MSQWVSGFAEEAIGVSKIIGDVFGLAFFGVMLGVGRTLYAKIGKNIINVMLFGMAGAAICHTAKLGGYVHIICYIVAATSQNAAVSLIACGITGICASMLWPGTLIYAEEKTSGLGVAAYALLAAGGDLGASISPQIVGIVADLRGIRIGLLSAALFPILGIILILFIKRYFNKAK